MENSLDTPLGFVDLELANGEIKEGEWRSHTQEDGGLQPLCLSNGGRRKIEANELRDSKDIPKQ